MKIIITESRREKLVIDWLNKNYSDLNPTENRSFPDYIFYSKNDEVFFDYDKLSRVLYVSYDDVWKLLESFFGMENSEIQRITKKWFSEYYGLEVTDSFKVYCNLF